MIVLLTSDAAISSTAVSSAPTPLQPSVPQPLAQHQPPFCCWHAAPTSKSLRLHIRRRHPPMHRPLLAQFLTFKFLAAVTPQQAAHRACSWATSDHHVHSSMQSTSTTMSLPPNFLQPCFYRKHGRNNQTAAFLSRLVLMAVLLKASSHAVLGRSSAGCVKVLMCLRTRGGVFF